jgi:hypothetical protein
MPIWGASFHEPDETPEEREARFAEIQKQIEKVVAKVIKENAELSALWAHATGRIVGEVMVQEHFPPEWIEQVQRAVLSCLARESGINET